MPLNTKQKSNLTMVIDQGSHASRIVLFSDTGELTHQESIEVSTRSPEQLNTPNFFEQDANEILESILTLLNNIPTNLALTIKNAGLCTQRSTVVAWHKQTGATLSPAISWRDTRSQNLINTLTPYAKNIREISGLPLSAHYSAGKIRWLLSNNKETQKAALEKHLCISPLASFLLFNLVKNKPIIIDHSNAQRCQLFDIHRLNWSDELLKTFQIERSLLPECMPVIHEYGELNFNNIPLTTVCGDQNAVLYAYPTLKNNNTLVNIGTGAFILSTYKKHHADKNNLLQTLASSNDNKTNFISEGTVNGAGSSLTWAQEKDSCNDLFSRLPIWLNQIESPPIFINSISTLGSPWWCDAGAAEFLGDDKNNQASRYVAIIESIIFLIYKNIEYLKSPDHTIYISGGLSKLDGLCQKLSDLSQLKILRFNTTEATARGCAWLANQSLKNNNLNWIPLQPTEEFSPRFELSKINNLHDRYQLFVGELNKRCYKD